MAQGGSEPGEGAQGAGPSDPSQGAVCTAPRRLPRWLKRNVPLGGGSRFTAQVIRELGLATVCEQAKCPNRVDCYAHRTATLMILGDVCTRRCGFCGVAKGGPRPVDPTEPARVAEAARRLGLGHVVITAVTRDDLPDGGAEHFCQTIAAVRQATSATIEVLPSDFAGNRAAVERVVQAGPEVYNHNAETVPRLYRMVRGPQADYSWTLDMFRLIKRLRPAMRTKTGLMLGLGETRQELVDTLADLLAAGVEMLTLGQYLSPSPDHLPVVRYVPPEEFDELGAAARQMGFTQVASGPLVRSSYHAWEMIGR